MLAIIAIGSLQSNARKPCLLGFPRVHNAASEIGAQLRVAQLASEVGAVDLSFRPGPAHDFVEHVDEISWAGA